MLWTSAALEQGNKGNDAECYFCSHVFRGWNVLHTSYCMGHSDGNSRSSAKSSFSILVLQRDVSM